MGIESTKQATDLAEPLGTAAAEDSGFPSPDSGEGATSQTAASLGDRLRERIGGALRWVSASNTTLFLVLLAVNALALPYAGLTHDAHIYSFLVLNRIEDGAFADDLFFRYGSADHYSVFSLAVTPAARVIGIPTCFFLFYLLSNSLLLLALQRFVRAVIGPGAVSTLALIYLAAVVIPFGGLRAFHVNESFLTPRLISNGLVLFGLERMLAGKLLIALALLGLALGFHPVMAFSGLLILGGWVLTQSLSYRGALFVVLSGFVALLVLAATPSGEALLGHMDGEWREQIRRAGPWNFPSEWTADDLANVLVAFGIVLTAGWSLRGNPPVRRLVLLIAAVAAVSLGGGFVAERSPFSLLLRGQPYRGLWLLQLLQVPLGFMLALQRWDQQTTAERCGAIALLGYLGFLAVGVSQFLLVLAPLPIFAICFRGLATVPRRADWWWLSATASVVLGLAVSTGLKLGLLTMRLDMPQALGAVQNYLRTAIRAIDPCWLVLAALGFVVLACRLIPARPRFHATMLAVSIAVQASAFAVPLLASADPLQQPGRADIEFVRGVLASHRPAGKMKATLYWPCGDWPAIWLELRANCYFSREELLGNYIYRATAEEGSRRAFLVRKFEIELFRPENLDAFTRAYIDGVLKIDFTAEPPSVNDLRRLCQDPLLDFVVARQKFDGLYAATNGTWHVYDCSEVRSVGAAGNEP
jgi:hypothetical protein